MVERLLRNYVEYGSIWFPGSEIIYPTCEVHRQPLGPLPGMGSARNISISIYNLNFEISVHINWYIVSMNINIKHMFPSSRQWVIAGGVPQIPRIEGACVITTPPDPAAL